ncbi:type IX secretion system plug protein [Puia dinghuensis]|uniref:DUF5103 domain-containing protein n=1 Tax=Puia dinghuensis TaxID=1792502 RepID=A0A8J2XPF9_9BACT|nr:DUF5103 domain-containing protein [Puia dinghuensis]GGA87880.1 DUF5103 domain-containing protein [Puia dinghuensis]
MDRKTCIYLLFLLAAAISGKAQMPDFVYSPTIGSPQLFTAANQLGYPIIRLNSSDQLELHFDDIDENVKNYYYTIVLCNEDWTPAEVTEFDYIKGFSQMRIENYRISSVALTHYVHYSALVPDANCVPIHSGNYMLKVYLDGDTSKLAFTKRFLVTDAKVRIQSQLLTPLNFEIARTHQNIQFRLNTAAINPPNPLDQIRVVILQNYRWDNAIHGVKPRLFLNNDLQYNNTDDINFEGGSEWRWVDLRSIRFLSDRILSANYGKTATDIFLRPDPDRSQRDFYFYQDYNGGFFITTTENFNPLWQTDYATVHFKFVPAGNAPIDNKDVYLIGRFNGGGLNDSTRMVFNADKGWYERNFLLKQGYYSYAYVTVDKNDASMKPSFGQTEGNHVETENDYMILVYYRALGARADELVGISGFNSLNK